MTWVCLRVQLRQERRVLSLLKDAGVLAYAPMEIRKVEVRTRLARRMVPRTSALLPGYIFAHLPDDRALDAARSIRLVRHVMADPFGKPRPVDLEKLRGLLLADIFKLFDQTYQPPKPKGYTPRWKPGQRVKVERGAFEGWIGHVIGFRGRQQIEVMFSMFGRERPMIVEDAKLAASVMEAA